MIRHQEYQLQMEKHVHRKKDFAKRLFALSLLSPAIAQALTLGDVTVRSHLMEPLVAEVPILGAEPAEIADLKLRVGSQQDFDRFGVARLAVHEQLQFEVQQHGGDWLVRVTSRDPVREPYLSIPLQALWRDGQLVREYTVFLDPRPVQRSAVATARPGTSPSRAAAQPAPAAASTAESYGPVRPGETLWPIARRLKPAGVSTEQMMMALLRANPDAFPDNNVNNLRAGAVLRIPALGEIQAQTAAEARQGFHEQTAAWRGQPAPQPVAEPEPTPAPAAAATPERAAADDSQLRILAEKPASTPAPATANAPSPAEQQMLLTLERVESERLELGALRTQVDQMEAEMQQMRRLLELKEQQIAALQATNEPSPPKPATAPAPVVTERPTVAKIAEPVAPPPQAKDLLGGWLTWVVAAGAGLVLIVLLLIRSKRRSGPDIPLDQYPGVLSGADRPYADVVAKLGGQRDEFGDLPPRTAANRDDEDEDVAAIEEAYRAGAPVGAAAADLDEVAQADQESPAEWSSPEPAEPVSQLGFSDAELDAWVRDLADEAEAEPAVAANDAADEIEVSEPSADFGDTGGDLDLDLKADAEPEIPSMMFEPLTADVDGADDGSEEIEIPELTLPNAQDDDGAAALQLELARAYIDVGDTEGARDILAQLAEESLEGADREEARRLLAELG